MGQENEEQAELIATIQHDHIKMKQWYNTAPEAKTALHAKYGSSYPSFWRDVVLWDGWKESRKLFLKSMELKEKKDRERMNDGGSTSSGTASNNDSSTDASAAAAPRKRRSRWGNSSTTSNSNDSSGDKPRKRKSRWGASADRGRDETPKPLSTNSTSVLDILPGLPTNLNSEQNQKLKELQKLLREANQKLENLEVEAARVDALPNDHPDRSPSPPPVYGVDGKRKNTRAFRWKERYTAQRQDTLEQILSLTTSNASATSSIAPSLFKRKRTRKIHIPVEDHPTYNFIGLIIGPRGKTQKEMENKTGCKIAIRGKGSVKEGARGRRDGKMMEGDDEPLHVVITGDNQANVDAAADMINDMLVVIDDDKNVHKQQQLRELALLNGTLKDDEYCPICAEKGHRAFECPKRFSMSKNAISVRCAICGDTSHPTRDCRQKAANGESAADAVKAEKELDSDYLAFMNELDGKPAGSNDTPSDTNAAAAAAAADRKQLASLVTTIEKSVGGVVTVCTPVPTTAKKIETVPAPASTTGNSLITTISSRIVKSAPEPTEALASTTLAGAPGISESQQPLITSLGSTTTASAVPLPGAVGGIPAVAGPVPGVTVPAPSAIAPPTSLPPPPSSLPPPPPSSNYYGQQQQQQPAGSYYPSQYQAQNQQYPNDYGHQSTAANQQNYYGQQNQQQQGAVSGWDYRNYYGSGHTGGDADGAGGFNWWES